MTLPGRLEKHAHLLHYLAKGKKSIVRVIINEADRDIINVLCECAHNIIQRNIPLTSSQKRNLRKHKSKFFILLDKKASIKKKKKALQQGGFLGTLLGAVLPVVIGAIASATS